jgi:hypothetical protein
MHEFSSLGFSGHELARDELETKYHKRKEQDITQYLHRLIIIAFLRMAAMRKITHNFWRGRNSWVPAKSSGWEKCQQ